jgi:hypothetical protein
LIPDCPPPEFWQSLLVARRLTLGISLLANLALAVALFVSLRREPAAHTEVSLPFTNTHAAHVTLPGRTNVVVRRQLFTWAELESSDYPTYIANLRRIGCPEPTIRDIIVADVNEMFERKMATEVVTADQQWWRSIPDPEIEQAALAKAHQLEADRRALLTSLLGPDWERHPLDMPRGEPPIPGQPTPVSLTGPILGALSAEAKQQVQNINSQGSQRMADYLAKISAANQQPDPAELARLRQQTRDELARVLTPTQLEEYLLRYSENGIQLRDRFRGLDLKPEEFRSLFRSLDSIDQQIQLLGSANDAASQLRRTQLDLEREHAVEQTLGADRYAAFQITRDPAFVQAKAAAQSAGATPEAAFGLYLINKLVEDERRRINADQTLTTAQRIEQLQHATTEQEKSLLALFGEEGYSRFRQSTNAATTATR